MLKKIDTRCSPMTIKVKFNKGIFEPLHSIRNFDFIVGAELELVYFLVKFLHSGNCPKY